MAVPNVVDQATQRTTIMASPERCFDVAVDFEQYPVWARDIKKARVLSRDRDGRAVDVEYWVRAMGRSTTYTLRYFYGSDPLRLAWRLQRGDATPVSTASTPSSRSPASPTPPRCPTS